jgi:hypothetical protein
LCSFPDKTDANAPVHQGDNPSSRGVLSSDDYQQEFCNKIHVVSTLLRYLVGNRLYSTYQYAGY